MKWLETIELRTTDDKIDGIIKNINEIMQNINSKFKPDKILIYKHINFETDLNIHLFYERPERNITNSFLGENIASWLQVYGIVSHNVWIKQNLN